MFWPFFNKFQEAKVDCHLVEISCLPVKGYSEKMEQKETRVKGKNTNQVSTQAKNSYSQPFNNILCIFLINILLTSAGTVGCHKGPIEEDCLSSNILCYECDSRQDPNCADPFDFNDSTDTLFESQNSTNLGNTLDVSPGPLGTNITGDHFKGRRSMKKYPPFARCMGCCVKITSRTPDGVTFVKRTCTSSLQINYFMVGLVCMKESGDRGKMCFCETDFCNGQTSSQFCQLQIATILLLISSFIILIEKPFRA